MGSSFDIRVDDLSGPAVQALLREHIVSMHEVSPPESIHALDVEQLRSPDVTFWSVWEGSELAGCGALLELSPEHGELKSMRTSKTHLRRGVAGLLVEHLMRTAIERGYRRLSLETGSQDAFAPARALYAKFGFEACGPFGKYTDDPNSAFMTREISS